MYRVMYKFNHMSRHVSAVAYDEKTDSLVEARFENKADAEALMEQMIRQDESLGIDEGLQIHVERVRVRKAA